MTDQQRSGGRPSTSDNLPHKPTKESATASSDLDEVVGGRPRSTDSQSPNPGAGRRSVDQGASSQKHPPHVTENDEDAPVQDEVMAPNEVPVLPANASGHDAVNVDEQDQPIDPESMYDNRPERDKDQPPSQRVD